MTYKPHSDFVALYDLYTGPRSLAAELAIRKGEATGDDPLLISTGSDLVLFPGGGRPPVVESFRHSTRGFKELTAVSHLGTAMAWLVEMQETGLEDWRSWAERFIAQSRQVREINRLDYWTNDVRVAAWKGLERKVVDVVDYACRVAEDYLAAGLADPTRLTFSQLRDDILEPIENPAVSVPFNDVMVATFALTFLDIAHRILTWLKDLDLDWQRLMVMICGSSGRPTAGLTWATNSTCHMLWRASGKTLQPERLLISPHAPGLNLDMLKDGADLAELERGYRGLWCKTRVTAELGAKMFEGFPAFVPDISAAPIITSETKTLSEMPRLTHPDDRLTAITRLRLVMEDPRQLLSNSVSEFVIDELCDKALDPSAVVIPGFTNVVYPEAGHAHLERPGM